MISAMLIAAAMFCAYRFHWWSVYGALKVSPLSIGKTNDGKKLFNISFWIYMYGFSTVLSAFLAGWLL